MQIPVDYEAFLKLSPEQVQQLCDEVIERPLDADSVDSWLKDFSTLAARFQECMARYDVATSVNTADEVARERQMQYRQTMMPIDAQLYQRVHQKLQTHAEIMPPLLRNIQARQAAMQELNQSQTAMDLRNREMALFNQYEQVIGAQSIEWEGEPLSPRRLDSLIPTLDRSQREGAWRAIAARQQQDYEAINRIWSDLIDVRVQLAEANGFDDYRTYRWAEFRRTDYTPDDNQQIHTTMQKHWSSVYAQLMKQRKNKLQLDTLRPWDMSVPLYEKTLKPFETVDELMQKTLNIFRRMDADFAAYVENLHKMGFIDLSERSNTTSMGGFSRAIGRHGNFIFMNIQRTHGDVVSLIHEIGHAYAHYEACKLPYLMYWMFPSDFIETPSIAIEILTQPYWDEFYNADDMKQAIDSYYASAVSSSLFECRIDAFEHWVYTNPDEARNPVACDAKWSALSEQFFPDGDNSGLEEYKGKDWRFAGVSFHMPFYALQYFYGCIAGLHLLTLPSAEAFQKYKAAIGLGNTVSTKELFVTLGVDFPITEASIISAKDVLVQRLDLGD